MWLFCTCLAYLCAWTEHLPKVLYQWIFIACAQEIEDYSVVYLDHIAALEAPYQWTSFKGGVIRAGADLGVLKVEAMSITHSGRDVQRVLKLLDM